jgi:hypothetical protein
MFKSVEKVSKKFKWKYTYYNLEFNTLSNSRHHYFQGNCLRGHSRAWKPRLEHVKGKALEQNFKRFSQNKTKEIGPPCLAEYTWSPHWFLSVVDQYNFGNSRFKCSRSLPVFGAVGRIDGPHRLSIGYGKRREGIFLHWWCLPSGASIQWI